MFSVYINIIYKVYFIFKSLIFILDSIRISFEAQNWVIMKEEDKIILVLIEYLRFWCDGASLKFRNMQMNRTFKVFITLNYG